MLRLKIPVWICVLFQVILFTSANNIGPFGTDCANKQMFPHQNDCTKYIECVWQKYGRYKLTEKDCPKNAYFDEVHADCIAGKCEDCLPEMPEFIMCYKPGQRFQDPNDCKKYFTCTYQQNCGGRSYWGYEVTECTKDKYFSQKKKRCVHKTKCPQGTSGGKNYFWDDHSDDEPYPHDSDEN